MLSKSGGDWSEVLKNSAFGDSHDGFKPQISQIAKSYNPSGDLEGLNVHDRLYARAVKQLTEQHNSRVDVMKKKLNLRLKPWENVRSKDAPNSWTQV